MKTRNPLIPILIPLSVITITFIILAIIFNMKATKYEEAFTQQVMVTEHTTDAIAHLLDQNYGQATKEIDRATELQYEVYELVK